jgi:hypothetical protein
MKKSSELRNMHAEVVCVCVCVFVCVGMHAEVLVLTLKLHSPEHLLTFALHSTVA